MDGASSALRAGQTGDPLRPGTEEGVDSSGPPLPQLWGSASQGEPLPAGRRGAPHWSLVQSTPGVAGTPGGRAHLPTCDARTPRRPGPGDAPSPSARSRGAQGRLPRGATDPVTRGLQLVATPLGPRTDPVRRGRPPGLSRRGPDGLDGSPAQGAPIPRGGLGAGARRVPSGLPTAHTGRTSTPPQGPRTPPRVAPLPAPGARSLVSRCEFLQQPFHSERRHFQKGQDTRVQGATGKPPAGSLLGACSSDG